MRDKKRSPNFTTDEVSILLKLVKKYKGVIECKQSDKFLWKNKVKIWNVIEEEFNAISRSSFRNAIVLRKKFENLKKDIKRKYGNEKCNTKTGLLNESKSQINSEDEEAKERIPVKQEMKELGSLYDDRDDFPEADHNNLKQNETEHVEYNSECVYNQRNNGHFSNSVVNDFFYMRPSSNSDDCLYDPTQSNLQKKSNDKEDELMALKIAFYETKTKYLKEEHNMKMKILELELKAKEKEFHRYNETPSKDSLIKAL